MSRQALDAVWRDLPVNHADALVLLVLADRANTDGECWPSVSTIGQTARMTRKTVQRALRRLEKAGRVETVLHGWGDGPWITRPNLYRVTRDGWVSGDAPRGSSSDAPRGVRADAPRGVIAGPQGGSSGALGGASEMTPKPILEPTTEPRGADEARELARARHPSSTNPDTLGLGPDDRDGEEGSRAHEALRLLAVIDTKEHPAMSYALALEHRAAEHLSRLVDLATRYPRLTPDQLATHILNAPAFDERNPLVEADGIEAARDALQGHYPESYTHDDDP